jgi:hypothetical protein
MASRNRQPSPQSLLCYALALLFGLLAGYGLTQQYAWLTAVAIAAACIAALAGILISKRDLRRQTFNAAQARRLARRDPAAIATIWYGSAPETKQETHGP